MLFRSQGAGGYLLAARRPATGGAALVAMLCVPIFVTVRRISRTEGALFVTAYSVYLGTLIFVRA